MVEELERPTRSLGREAHRRLDRWVPAPVQRLVAWLRSDDFFSTSSSLAYYSLISLAPMVLVALWIAGSVVSDEALEGLGSQVDQASPDELPVGDILQSLIRVATAIGVVSVIGALWPATAYGAALARVFGRITPENRRRVPGLKGRLFGLVIVAMLPLAVFAGVALVFAGPRLLPDTGPWLTVAFAAGAYVLLVLLIGGVFTLFRTRDATAADVTMGAVTSASLITLVTGGYVVYLELFADFQGNYGATSLATVVLLALWLLLANAMLMVGFRVLLRRGDGLHAADRDHE